MVIGRKVVEAVFSFIKKMFTLLNGEQSPSTLMEKAMNSAMTDRFGRMSSFFIGDASSQHHHFHNDMQHQHMMDMHNHDMMHRQMEDMHNPYLNPGQDLVVDQTYHGIDHGMDHSMNHGMDHGGHHHGF